MSRVSGLTAGLTFLLAMLNQVFQGWSASFCRPSCQNSQDKAHVLSNSRAHLIMVPCRLEPFSAPGRGFRIVFNRALHDCIDRPDTHFNLVQHLAWPKPVEPTAAAAMVGPPQSQQQNTPQTQRILKLKAAAHDMRRAMLLLPPQMSSIEVTKLCLMQ